ncbi:two-component system probable response regulator PhcQ [Oxalobacteraceae bacterium GrIS 1.18]
MKRILILDDEDLVLSALQRGLRTLSIEEGLSVELFSSAAAAIKRLEEARFQVVISDYHMPEMLGTDFLKLTMAMQPDAIRLMLSASAEFRTILGAVNEAEVFRFIAKPWDIAELEEIIRLALKQVALSATEHQLADEARLHNKQITPQELEKKRLETEEPGITNVKWGPDGSVIID